MNETSKFSSYFPFKQTGHAQFTELIFKLIYDISVQDISKFIILRGELKINKFVKLTQARQREIIR